MAACASVSRALIGYQPRAKRSRLFPGKRGLLSWVGTQDRESPLCSVLALPPTGESPPFPPARTEPQASSPGSGLAAAHCERPHRHSNGEQREFLQKGSCSGPCIGPGSANSSEQFCNCDFACRNRIRLKL